MNKNHLSNLQKKKHTYNHTKRCFHRGYYIESKTGDPYDWKVKINGKFITGRLDKVRECIDWRLDVKKDLPIETPTLNKLKSRKITKVKYKNCNILNDHPQYDIWYMVVQKKLYTGSLLELKKLIDKAHGK
ncbi:DUF3319 domain-containing protein [Photobacterium makurazakiensis]|uniref:DUF3319 domain-containing protein n=1 Tax=Photobacterium makurazakiensis TaxID=2910234 RepID=UPI003D0C3FFF